MNLNQFRDIGQSIESCDLIISNVEFFQVWQISQSFKIYKFIFPHFKDLKFWVSFELIKRDNFIIVEIQVC